MEEDLRTGDFRVFSTYMRPVPIVPTFTRIFIYGSHREPSNIFQHFSNVSNALNALEHVLPTHLTHVKKAEISDLTAFSAEKSQIHNIKLRFRNI